MFDEFAIGNHLLELFLSDEVVVFAIDLSRTWGTGCVCIERKAQFGLEDFWDVVPYARH